MLINFQAYTHTRTRTHVQTHTHSRVSRLKVCNNATKKQIKNKPLTRFAQKPWLSPNPQNMEPMISMLWCGFHARHSEYKAMSHKKANAYTTFLPQRPATRPVRKEPTAFERPNIMMPILL